MKNNIHSQWFVYIVQCNDDTFYTGLTYNIDSRIKTHNSGKGAIYTHGRGPVKLIHSEKFSTHREAAQRECTIKKLTRQQKEEMIKNFVL
jgi:putative endonuclease